MPGNANVSLRRYRDAIEKTRRIDGHSVVDLILTDVPSFNQTRGCNTRSTVPTLNEAGRTNDGLGCSRIDPCSAPWRLSAEAIRADEGRLGSGSTIKSWYHQTGLFVCQWLVRVWRTPNLGHRNVSPRSIARSVGDWSACVINTCWDSRRVRNVASENPDDLQTGKVVVPETIVRIAGDGNFRRGPAKTEELIYPRRKNPIA